MDYRPLDSKWPIARPLCELKLDKLGVKRSLGGPSLVLVFELVLRRLPVPGAVFVFTGDCLAVSGTTSRPVIVVAAVLAGFIASILVVYRVATGRGGAGRWR